MIRQYELVEAVKAYDPDADEDLLNRAYVFAMKAHGAQTRASGDPYFTHPLEVAGILVGMRLDVATIVTALLHDTVEDTLATSEEIEQLFGKEVSFLVDGVTKLSQIQLQSDKTKQAENFRKLLVAMSSDIRVLLVKLADRLHNMRTLHYIKNEEKRKRIALETSEIYAPLSERIGMHEVKDELQDIAFGILHPDARDSIVQRLTQLREQNGDLTTPVIDELHEVLSENGLAAIVAGREKTPCSIWGKMKKKNITFEQISDIVAFRIIVDTVQQCYRALGILHSTYPVIAQRFKDYISTPKENGYQSLHTAVIGPNQQRVEVQIRTKEMDEIVEMGVAAHWQYKQGTAHDGHQYRWLRDLLDILETAEDPEDFLEHTKLEMFQDQVFCFTPDGDLITLPRGATAIDFAYAVHSDVGNHCSGVKINGRIMPLRTEIENGDQVEVMTSKSQFPSPSWERFVITGKARSSIRRYIRQQKRQQFVKLGKSLIQKSFKEAKLDFEDKALEAALKEFQARNVEDIYSQVGEGLRTSTELIRFLHPELPQKVDLEQFSDSRERAIKGSKEEALGISGLIPGMAVHYAGCCHPLPGDKIVGIVTTGRGVTIHTQECDSLNPLMDEPELWIDVAWDLKAAETQQHIGRLRVTVANQPGAIAAITAAVAKESANITNLKIDHRSQDYYEFWMDLDVKNAEHLNSIVAALRVLKTVLEVDRAKS
jgi:guanosine-3',5'-bis(diphosphate) 3'-pyrophosphohydrolase